MLPGQNRKEGNDQESIQLSHTSHQRHQRERNTNKNNWTLMETSLAESQPDTYFPTSLSFFALPLCVIGKLCSVIETLSGQVCHSLLALRFGDIGKLCSVIAALPGQVCHGLFALPLGVIGRLCSVIAALPG